MSCDFNGSGLGADVIGHGLGLLGPNCADVPYVPPAGDPLSDSIGEPLNDISGIRLKAQEP